MRHSFLFAGLMLVVGALNTGCVSESDHDRLTAAAQVDQKFVDAFNHRDVDAVMQTYWNNPDLVVYPPDSLEAHGFAGVKDAYAKSFTMLPKSELILIDPHYRVAGEAVIGWGTWKMVMKEPAGAELQGRFVDVIEKKDGKWVYTLDSASAPLMAPPAGK